jgi:hypothetical protein
MNHQRALAALAAAALLAGAGIATGAGAQTLAQTTAQTKATVANEVGNPIDAPETVDPGQQVSVSVSGAPQGASIEVWGPVGQAGRGERLSSVPLTGGSALISAPLVSASYELRYVDANGSTRAQRAFEVAASPVMLEVPVDVNANATMQVTWRGPAKAGDMLQIVDPATGTVLQSTPVAGDPGAPNVSQLAVPDYSGPLELRYVALDGTVLRSIGFHSRRLGG